MSKDTEAVAPYVGETGEPYITAWKTPVAGYAVRIPNPAADGEVVQRNFKGASRTLAEHLVAARTWRDETYLKLYGVSLPQRVFHRQQANSQTGVAGVRLVIKKTRSRHNRDIVYEVPTYVAEVWLQPGQANEKPRRSRGRLFSIKKYCETEAFALAFAFRASAERALQRGAAI